MWLVTTTMEEFCKVQRKKDKRAASLVPSPGS
jgi:hypothetical protein